MGTQWFRQDVPVETGSESGSCARLTTSKKINANNVIEADFSRSAARMAA